MTNLFDTMATGSQIELFQVVESFLEQAFSGKSTQFFYNLDIYLQHAPTARADMEQRGRATLEQYATRGKWKKKDELLESIQPDYATIFCALENYVHIGADMDKEDFPTALYTRNRNTLELLHQNGQLNGDITKIIAALDGSRTEKSVNDGKFLVVRLDHEATEDGKPIFKPVIPRSTLEIGVEKQYVIIPVPFMYMFDRMSRAKFQNQPFNFVKSSVIGQVAHNATISKQVVEQIYKGSDENLVESKIIKIKPGYDPLKQRFFAYNLESSLTSLGISTFRPEMLDSIRLISPQDIDTSMHNVNFTLLRGIYKTRINQAKSDQLESLNLLDLSSFANMKDKAEALIALADRKSDKELFYIMRNNPDVFGDLDKGLEARERVTPRFMKGFKSVPLPNSLQERKEALQEMLNTGIIRFTATKKKGGIFERYGTNNPQVLERMLGKDYVKNFESIRNKLYHVKTMLKNGEASSRADLEKLGVEYNLLDYVDHQLYFSDAINKGDTSNAILAIDNAIEELRQKSANRKVSEGALLYRDVYATEPKELYGSVNVNNLMAVDYSQVE